MSIKHLTPRSKEEIEAFIVSEKLRIKSLPPNEKIGEALRAGYVDLIDEALDEGGKKSVLGNFYWRDVPNYAVKELKQLLNRRKIGDYPYSVNNR